MPDVIPEKSIVVVMNEEQGEKTSFRVKPTMKVAKLMTKFEQHKGVRPGTYRFLVDGNRLPPADDNQKLIRDYVDEGEYEEDEQFQIDCQLEQLGGNM